MKRSITSNLRLPSLAFYAFIIASAVLWAMPSDASAQAYGIQQRSFRSDIGNFSDNAPPGSEIDLFVVDALGLAKYNIQTRHRIFLIPPLQLITFVAADLRFIGEVLVGIIAAPRSAFPQSASVAIYDATTGAPINPDFILFQPPPGARVDKCTGLALKGNTLFVVFQLHGPGSDKSGIVGKYDAETGAPIDANFITGLNRPSGLAVLGNTLFVANFGTNSSNGTVGEYDAKTGAPIDANFITGLNGPGGLALLGNTLLVPEEFKNTVGKYDAETGAPIDANFITGLSHPISLALFDDTLFVANFFSGTVGEYDAKTGAVINANLITGLSEPVSIAVGANQNQ